MNAKSLALPREADGRKFDDKEKREIALNIGQFVRAASVYRLGKLNGAAKEMAVGYDKLKTYERVERDAVAQEIAMLVGLGGGARVTYDQKIGGELDPQKITAPQLAEKLSGQEEFFPSAKTTERAAELLRASYSTLKGLYGIDAAELKKLVLPGLPKDVEGGKNAEFLNKIIKDRDLSLDRDAMSLS